MVDEDPRTELTEDQIRVLRALAEAAVEVNPGDPTVVGILDTIMAEQLGMTIEEIQGHVEALIDRGMVQMQELPPGYWMDDDDPEYEGLSWDEKRVYEAYLMAKETDRPHRTHTDMAAQLGMTVQEIDDHCEVLTARGLLNKTWDRLTEDQQRVLMAMPAWRPDMPDSGPGTAELAEQLAMSVEDVRECIRVLDEGRWLWGRKPRSVLDALIQWGWHTPADELAERLNMDIGEVDQRLLELAEIGYDVRLI